MKTKRTLYAMVTAVPALALGALMLLAAPVLGATNYWRAGSAANWSDDAAWSLEHEPLATEDVVLDGTDSSDCRMDSGTGVALSVTVVSGYTGEFWVQLGKTLDIDGSLTSDATFTMKNEATIEGNVNFGAATPTWTGAGIITVDEDGTLDLGTDTANSQSVDVAADVTIGDHFTCLGFDGSSGVITGAAKTITVGSGGLTNGGATLDAVGTLNVIVAETPAAFDWAAANSNHSLGTVTVNAAATMTGTVYTTKVAGSAAIAIDSRLYVRAMAADFWTNTATHSGSSQVVMYAYSGSYANTALINLGTCEFEVQGGNGTTTTLNGGLTCGVLDLNATAQNLVVNGPLSASGNTTLDDATLTLGSAATHSFGGTITSGSTGILIIDGTSTFAGNVTTTGIAVTVKTGSTTTLSSTAVWDNDAATEFEAGVTAFTCYGFDGSSGVITGGGNTVTVGAGGLDLDTATLDAPGTLNITVAESCAGQWDSTTHKLGLLTVSTGATLTIGATEDVFCTKLAGAGTIATNTARRLWVYQPDANDFWTFTGTITAAGTGDVRILLVASRENTAAINVGSTPLDISGTDNVLTANGNVTCAALVLRRGAGTGYGGLTMGSGAGLTATSVVLGTAASADLYGVLVLASGTHSIGALAVAAGNTAANAVTYGGNVTLTGHQTLANITSDFGHARGDAGAVTFLGTNATSISNAGAIITGRTGAVTFTDMDTNWNAGDPPILARRWTDGTGNGVRVQTAAPHWLIGVR